MSIPWIGLGAFIAQNGSHLREHWHCPGNELREGQQLAVINGFNQFSKISEADNNAFVTKTFYLVDMPPAESSIRFDDFFFEVHALRGEDRVSIKVKGDKDRAAEAFFVDNRMQFCRMWTGSGKTLVLWLAALGNHPFPRGSEKKVWVWCSTLASRDSIADEVSGTKSGRDSENWKEATRNSSLLYKSGGLSLKTLEWLMGRVYIGRPNKTLSNKDIEDHDIFILSPQSVHTLGEPVRDHFLEHVGMILVDEGDWGTAEREGAKWVRHLLKPKAFITFFSATDRNLLMLPEPYAHVTYASVLKTCDVRLLHFTRKTGEELTTEEAFKHRRLPAVSTEIEAREIIRAGLEVFFEFLNAPENHGFPGQLGVFIMDSKDSLEEGAKALLRPEKIVSLFKEALYDLAEAEFASLSIRPPGDNLDSDSEEDEVDGYEVYDSVRMGPVRVVFYDDKSKLASSPAVIINKRKLGRSYNNARMNSVFVLRPCGYSTYVQLAGRPIRQFDPANQKMRDLCPPSTISAFAPAYAKMSTEGRPQRALVIDLVTNDHEVHAERILHEEGHPPITSNIVRVDVPVGASDPVVPSASADTNCSRNSSSATFQEVLPTVQFIVFDESIDTCSYDIEWPSLRFDDLKDPGYSITLINSSRNIERNERHPRPAGRGDAKGRNRY
ncbi:hypothetical protein KFL_000330380 [Klebsormidium nitens]|uniref:Helicase ATP-binding domain-containing protein n=1 Tax=Klebsormidium nitens TaxID=105231 RepID=A0A1Y1HP87_KLENI|nr:hypothetical protein KFL_000330380 [Klebsormidium nitens]|eukprot:GAQ79592.1 hypothetical protein KFL_000330380 [Klebsormidium nitens]